jgi:SAM-dependent methyltransferase
VDGVSLTYGEISFPSMAAVLAQHWRTLGSGNGKFIDIGSGTGRAVFGAYLLHEFESITGVEILRGLARSSQTVANRFEKEVRPLIEQANEARIKLHDQLTAHTPHVASSSAASSLPLAVAAPHPSITLLHADFRDVDWSDADVVYVNSTCFDADLMDDLASYAVRLKRGALIITYTHSLMRVGADGVSHFKLLSDDMYEQSWGSCTVYAHRKMTAPVWLPIEKRYSADVDELDKIISPLPEELTSTFRAKLEIAARHATTEADEPAN